MPAMDGIPMIDFSAYSLEIGCSESVPTDCLQNVKQDVYNALSTVGFCYLKNHGFPADKVEKMMSTSKTFFEQPNDVKEKYAKTPENEHGWVSAGREYFDADNPVGDSKECFNYIPHKDSEWSDDTVAGLRDVCRDFYKNATEFAMRILDIMSLAFLPDHRDFLRKCHSQLGQEGNERYLRSLYYPNVVKGGLQPLPPSVPSDSSYSPRVRGGEAGPSRRNWWHVEGQWASPKDSQYGVNEHQPRCGEHTDYGSLTILWQDDCGGLEIRTNDGKYVNALPIPGTVLINIGDLMQRWTADKLVATRHRVVHRPETNQTQKPRQSIAFFTGPNDDTLIKCLDGSGKYDPVMTQDFYDQRFKNTYLY